MTLKGQARTIRRWPRWVIALGNLHRRLLAVGLWIIGPRLAYAVMKWAACIIYRLLDPLRERCEAQCREATAGFVSARDVARVARESFVHRVWNLTDLMLSPYLLKANTYEEYGGRLGRHDLTDLTESQRSSQPVILLTAYFGSFDLLPIFLGYNGLRVATVYLPHRNAGFDTFRRRIRGQSGCEMVPLADASTRFEKILGQGGMVALVADHHVEKGGMPATFLGIETKVLRSVGLLAWRYQADVVVAGNRRVNDAFEFEVCVVDVIKHQEWAGLEDPVHFVTNRYLRALEQLIKRDPAQYLWAYARWGQAFARQATNESKQKQQVM